MRCSCTNQNRDLDCPIHGDTSPLTELRADRDAWREDCRRLYEVLFADEHIRRAVDEEIRQRLEESDADPTLRRATRDL